MSAYCLCSLHKLLQIQLHVESLLGFLFVPRVSVQYFVLSAHVISLLPAVSNRAQSEEFILRNVSDCHPELIVSKGEMHLILT